LCIDQHQQIQSNAGSLAERAEWVAVSEVKQLAFDHNNIFSACWNHLRHSIRTKPIGFELLPDKFTLSQLQDLYEAILQQTLDKRNFRKKILSMNILVDNKEQQKQCSSPTRSSL
jgi:8-oxo-dGTP diphosphatase